MGDSASTRDGPQATLFGKLPASLDFVRINHTTSEAIALDQWIQAAVQHLAQRNANWPAQRLRFVLRSAAGASSIVGVIAPSRDRAGRKYPIALFAPCAPSKELPETAAVALGAERFLAQAEHQLELLSTLNRSQYEAQLADLAPPGLSEYERAVSQVRAELLRATAVDFLTRLHDTGTSVPVEQRVAALRDTLCSLRHHAPQRPLVLDCPVRSPLDVRTWVALVQRATTRQDRTPSLLWSAEEAHPRVLMSVDALPPTVPLWFAEPRIRSDKLRTLLSVAAETPASAHSLPTQLPADLTLAQLVQVLADDA